MNVSTKFSVGDSVWTIKDDKAVCLTIQRIILIVDDFKDGHIEEQISYVGMSPVGKVTVPEQRCVASKELLVDIL